MGGKNSVVVYHVDPKLTEEIREAQAKLDALRRTLEEKSDAKAYVQSEQALFQSFLKQLRAGTIRVERIPKVDPNDPLERNIAFIGGISTGKTTLINSLTGSNEEVGIGETTLEIKRVIKTEHIVYWDVPGNNKDCDYYSIEKMAFLKAMDKLVILSSTDAKDCQRLLLLCDALKVPYIFCRTRCDEPEPEELVGQPERDARRLKEIVGHDVKRFMISAKNKSIGSGDLFDWVNLCVDILNTPVA